MSEKRKGEIIGYCYYCKEAIYLHDTYIVHDGEKYHKDCFAILANEAEIGVRYEA